METAVKRIGAVVVAELRACGYMESTIGQYEKTIRALTNPSCKRSSGTRIATRLRDARSGERRRSHCARRRPMASSWGYR